MAKTITGTFGKDTITGGISIDNIIYGLRGADVLGDQLVMDWGPVSDDSVHGGRGKDTLLYYSGNDILKGGLGNDDFHLWKAFDDKGLTIRINGGAGYDEVFLHLGVGAGHNDVTERDNGGVRIEFDDMEIIIKGNVEFYDFI